jgi:Ca2+-transporting ATPase
VEPVTTRHPDLDRPGQCDTASGASGLSSEEAASRLAVLGPNELTRRHRISVWSSIAGQVRDPLILVLLGACVLTTATAELAESAVIILVVIVNSAIGVVQEVRADRAVVALSQLTAPRVRVRRDAREAIVPAPAIVPGDVVLLAEGDVVPADGCLLHASDLLIDESSLTGESVPVGKTGPDPDRIADALSAGTVVAKGRAVLEVTATGPASALGRIDALIDTRVQMTPLQRRLARLGRYLAVAAIALSFVVLVSGLVRGEPTEMMIVTAVSLSVAAVPESLPAVVTLSLALGARRMANRNAIVRRLPAVETLGSVSALATDKTGTLTQGQMVVVEAWTGRRSVEISGDGYSPTGDVVDSSTGAIAGACPDVLDLLRAAALCNDATLVAPAHEGDPWTGVGDPTELALLAAAGKGGLTREELAREWPRVEEEPFDSRSQRMTTIHRHGDERLVVTKGAPEVIIGMSALPGDAAGREEVGRRAAGYAERGYRVLAVAAGFRREATGAVDSTPDLRLLGLVAIADPPKQAARDTVAACRAAGITPLLITGDHPATARAIAHDVGILGASEDGIVSGQQIAFGEVPDLTRARVFARTTPEQKLDIVQAWRDRGEIIAMTGDGVNDGPALRRSDIGVAMGRRGTEVARQAADLVLADDELSTVVAAVEEGRRIYANIRRFLVFGLAGGATEILVMLLGPFVGLTVPLLAGQILWINLLTHGLTGVAMGAEPVEAGSMLRPPRPPRESVLGDGLWKRTLWTCALLTGTALLVATWGLATQRPWQTILFVSITSLQLGVALGLRPRLWTRDNPSLPTAVLVSLLLAVAAVYVPLLRNLLGTVTLPISDLLIAVGTGIVGWLAASTARWVMPERAPKRAIGVPHVPAVRASA